MIVGDGPIRVEVHGIGHRHPTAIVVGWRLAARLVEAGAPLTVRIERPTERASVVAS
jgi:hypothetical protein